MKNLINWIQEALDQKQGVQIQQNFETTQGWMITVKGTVKSFSKRDIDKSGRNPKFVYFVTINKEKAFCESCDFELGEKVRFRVKEKQVLAELGREIKHGDTIEVKSSGIERNPKFLSVSSIKLVADD
ncbi:MAG: hypothetical protein ACFB0C_20445 [Leptolyngbyaceae cyanobacterium]